MCLAIPGPAMIQLSGEGGELALLPGGEERSGMPLVHGALGAFSQAAEFLKYPNSVAAL